MVLRERMKVAAGRATQHRDERVLGELRDLADRADPALVEPGGGLRPDTPEPLDRQRVEELELSVGRDDEQAVGLRDAARNLGEELRARDANGDREADPLAHLAPQARSDLFRRACEPLHSAHVEEGLVDREPLDERCRVLEDPEHLSARLRVRVHPRRDDHGVRAEAARLSAAHRGADAVRLRFVARRQHDPRTDDDRPSSQRGIVPLLDRREERVDVGVEDRRLHANTCSHTRRGNVLVRRTRRRTVDRRATYRKAPHLRGFSVAGL